MFAASEYMVLMQSEEKRLSFGETLDFGPFLAFNNLYFSPEFIRQLLELLLSWGLNPNIPLGGSRTQHILLSLLELVNLVRNPSDLDYVYDLTLTLIQVKKNF